MVTIIPAVGFVYPSSARTLILALPAVIKPWRKWVDTSRHEWSSSRGGYWETGEREYGFTVYDGHLSIALGRVTNDSSTEQRWGWFLPWRAWRHIRRSFYGPAGEWLANEPHGHWDAQRAVVDAMPTVGFAFDDFDGEHITATTRMEEREWRLGKGKWRWLSVFRRPKINRSLDISFSSETGKRKGSWKGGTVGHSIKMLPGELHEAAFRRYCRENAMTFVGITTPNETTPS